jgi:O-antigen ligase
LAVIFIVLASAPVVERILTFEKMDKLEGREKIYGGIVEMIQDHPILGAGPGTFATIYTQYQPPGFGRRYFYGHNDYLQLISETGLPLIAIMVWMIIALYKKGLNKLKNPSRLVRGITLGAMSGITAILFHSTVDFNLHIPANAILFTVLAAFVAAPIPE